MTFQDQEGLQQHQRQAHQQPLKEDTGSSSNNSNNNTNTTKESVKINNSDKANNNDTATAAPVKPYACPSCDLRFNSMGARNSHKRKVHQRSFLCERYLSLTSN